MLPRPHGGGREGGIRFEFCAICCVGSKHGEEMQVLKLEVHLYTGPHMFSVNYVTSRTPFFSMHVHENIGDVHAYGQNQRRNC